MEGFALFEFLLNFGDEACKVPLVLKVRCGMYFFDSCPLIARKDFMSERKLSGLAYPKHPLASNVFRQPTQGFLDDVGFFDD